MRSRRIGRSCSATRRASRHFVANLPYSIATLLLTGWLDTEPWPPWFERMVLMFQKEVAERIVAAPGTKAYGRLAVLAQWRTRPRIVLTLRPRSVHAAARRSHRPSSSSCRTSRPEPPCSVTTLARVTAAAFGQRRKMLR